MSSSSGISGLGISFLPSPPRPSSAAQSQANVVRPRQDGYAGQDSGRTMRHSVSYDVGLNRGGWDKQHHDDNSHLESEPMIWNDPGDSAHRRVRIAAGEPEVLGEKHHRGRAHHPVLSPLSDFDSSSSDSQAFSPASMSSLPSSTDEAPSLDFSFERGRLAQSMGGAMPFRVRAPAAAAPEVKAAQSRPYPLPIDDLPTARRPYLRPHPNHERPDLVQAQALALAAQPPPTSSSSRLPAFIRERTRTRDLARPKSMMELGERYAHPDADQSAHAATVDHARQHFGLGGGGTQMMHSLSAQSGDQADDEDHEDLGEGDYGHQSPDSIPSSAGGLQRRHFERRLVQHQQLERERTRREMEELQQRSHLPSHPSASERVQQSRTRGRAVSHPAGGDAPTNDSRAEVEPPAMRSIASMLGLRTAETGGGFVQLDTLSQTFSEGEHIDPQATSEGMRSGEEIVIAREHVLRNSVALSRSDGGLARQSTLLTVGANPVRRSKELDRLLSPTKKGVLALNPVELSPQSTSSAAGSSPGRPRSGSQSSSRPGVAPSTPVVLEQAKNTNKARVELDLVLETALVVEGGALKGRIEVRVRKPKDKESEVWLGVPKVRVVGFEELASHDARHIFYHHASSIASIDGPASAPTALPCVDSVPDIEGFQKAVIGQHVVPFSLRLPIGKGAKGGWKGKQGVVRYIVIASIKLKSADGSDRSIAHFYRHVEIFPYLNPAAILAPALKPLLASGSKSLFMGGSGKVTLSARMHRSAWVAGQRCYVDVRVENESSKKMKTLNLTLLRTTTVFRPRPWLNTGDGHDPDNPHEIDVDADACQTQTTRKKVAETTLEMGKKVNKGVTATGSWMGVSAGETADFSHFLPIPPDALTVLRGRYIEITYTLKVAVSGSLSADVSADIPVRVVNFVSLDPPPGHIGELATVVEQSDLLAKSWSRDQLRATHKPLDGVRKQAALMASTASADSLHLSDLNGARGLHRADSHADSLRTEDLSRCNSTTASTLLPYLASDLNSEVSRGQQATHIIGRAKDRRLNHQMSLDCISTAIASATARRGGTGHQRTESTLRTEVRNDREDREEPEYSEMYYGGGGESAFQPLPYDSDDAGRRLELDDLDDVPDDEDYYRRQKSRHQPSRHSQVDLAGESEDELDAVLDASPLLEDSDDESPAFAAPQNSHRPTTPTSVRIPTSVVRSRPASPVKAATDPPKSAMRRSEPFVFATASSPLKVIDGFRAPASPTRMAPPSPARRPQPHPETPTRTVARGPLPPPPTFPVARVVPTSPTKVSTPDGSTASSRAKASTLQRQPSTTSLKRANVVTKRASVMSLRPSPMLSDHSEPPELDTSSAKSSPELEPTRTPPMALTQAPSSPRKVVGRSPALTSSRSMGDLRGARIVRQNPTVLPSVRSKIQALETRQTTLAKLATSGSRSRLSVAQPTSHAMQRGSSASDSEVSFDLSRANSIASFQAPMLRKVHRNV